MNSRFLLQSEVADGEGIQCAADDERLLLEARHFQQRIPQITP